MATPNSAPPAQYNITPIIGVDITGGFPSYSTPASSATGTQLFYPENNNPNFSPGTIVMAGGGATYMLGQVGTVGSINTGDFVAWTVSIASTFTFQQITSTQAALGCRVGIWQGSAIGYGTAAGLPASSSTATQWAWVALSGSNLVGNVVSTTSANVPLFVSSIAGALTSVSTTGFLVAGVSNETSTGGATQAIAIVANPMMIFQYTSGVTVFGPF